MRLSMLSLIVIALAAEVAAAGPENRFVSGDYGISIEAPASKNPTAGNSQIAAFFLPPSDNFSASVNIMRQQSSESLEAFDKTQMAQFKQFKITVLNRTLMANEARYEYKGDIQGRTFHYYLRAVRAGRYLYPVLATGLESQWEQQKPLLMKSVESFTVKP